MLRSCRQAEKWYLAFKNVQFVVLISDLIQRSLKAGAQHLLLAGCRTDTENSSCMVQASLSLLRDHNLLLNGNSWDAWWQLIN